MADGTRCDECENLRRLTGDLWDSLTGLIETIRDEWPDGAERHADQLDAADALFARVQGRAPRKAVAMIDSVSGDWSPWSERA